MNNNLTKMNIHQILDWSYDKAVNGALGLDSAIELAEDYIKDGVMPIEQANSLIRWQIAKCTTSGFITGLGGLLTLPVAIPANIGSVMYVQIRMIAAIAHIGGYDVRNDKVKSLVYASLCGSAAADILKEVGIKIGVKFTERMIQNISREVIVKINQAVGFRLLTNFGSTGMVNLGKAVPVVGGLIGGTIDGIATNTIGNVALNIFIAKLHNVLESGRKRDILVLH